MCTAFVKKGNDRIVGFNFDLAKDAFQYDIYKTKSLFYIGVTAGSTTYKTHGVNKNGNSGNLPYMNGTPETKRFRGAAYQRIDLLNDRFIAGKLDYAALLETVKAKTLVNIPGMSMHSLFSDRAGHMLLVEPGLGYRELAGDFALITNFPALDPPENPAPAWCGVDRYETGLALLQNSGPDFSVSDAFALLRATAQDEPWATRVSFVYSENESAVYYTEHRDFSHIQRHAFS